MTPEYIASKLSELPQFTVEIIDREPEKYWRGIKLLGVFSSRILETQHRASFYLPDLRWFGGSVVAASADDRVRVVREVELDPLMTDLEIMNVPLAYCTCLRGQVALAIDPEIDWKEAQVEPDEVLEKVRFQDDEGHTHCISLDRFGGNPLPPGSEIFQASWNHVHCVFCSDRTESGETGYVGNHSPPDKNWADSWVCPWCYRNVVEPHNLRPILIPKADRV